MALCRNHCHRPELAARHESQRITRRSNLASSRPAFCANRGGSVMCRWIAYRGETTALEHYVTEPEHSLVTQSLRALEATTGTNGDGFGLGWYGSHPEPGLYRETRPAWSDETSVTSAVICTPTCF